MDSEGTVIRHMEEEGFTAHFTVRGDTLRSVDTGDRFAPRDVVIRQIARYEGVSDPDDMSIMYAIEGRGGERGTLVDAFGVYSDPAVSSFVEAVPAGARPTWPAATRVPAAAAA
jgi:hypothetical protein